MNQSTRACHICINSRVGIWYFLAFVRPGFCCIHAFAIKWGEDVQTILQSCLIIICTMTGGSMNTTCSGLRCDVICEYKEGITIHKGVTAFSFFKPPGGECCLGFVMLCSCILHHFFNQILCKNPCLITNFYCSINKVRVQGNGQISRKSPWSSGPDNDIEFIPCK